MNSQENKIENEAQIISKKFGDKCCALIFALPIKTGA